jgi:hypothetical protein
VRVASSAAEIESNRVRIWTRDSTPESAPLTWDEAAQAYTYFDRLFVPPCSRSATASASATVPGTSSKPDLHQRVCRRDADLDVAAKTTT